VLVLLAIVLVVSPVAFGACAAPAKRTVTPEEGRTLPEEVKAPPEEEKAPEEKVVPPEETKALGGFCPAVTDLNASPEGTNSARLNFTSTFTGDKAESGTYRIICSTEPITKLNCMQTPPLLSAASPGRDVWVGTFGGAGIIPPPEGEEGTIIIEGLELDTTYDFAVWIINEPGEDLTDEGYRESISNIVTYTTPSTETRTAIFTAGTCDVLRLQVGSEACTPRDAVADWIDDHYYGKLPCCKDCGEEQVGRYWAHSFTDLTFDGFEGYLSVIDSATLKIHLRNNDENDHLKIGSINASGDSWEVNQQLTYFGVAVGETKTITVDLSDVAGVSLLDDMMSNNFLDVAVDDDSTVYCLQLILGYTCISTEDWPRATGNKGGFAVGGFNAA